MMCDEVPLLFEIRKKGIHEDEMRYEQLS